MDRMPAKVASFPPPTLRETTGESRRENAQPKNLHEAVRSLVHDSAPQTPKGIASDVGVGYAYLLKAADEHQEDVQFQARLVAPTTIAAKNDVLIKFLAAACGGVFYRLGPAGAIDAATAKSLKEFGEYLAAVADAQGGVDPKTTPAEYHHVKGQALEAIAAILAHIEGLRVVAGVHEGIDWP